MKMNKKQIKMLEHQIEYEHGRIKEICEELKELAQELKNAAWARDEEESYIKQVQLLSLVKALNGLTED